MARNLGVADADVHGRARRAPTAPTSLAGADVEARVTVRMPAVELPGIGAVDAWSWTARHREPVDLYAAPA